MTLADAGQDVQAQTEAAKAEKLLEPATWYLTRAYVDQPPAAAGRRWKTPLMLVRWRRPTPEFRLIT